MSTILVFAFIIQKKAIESMSMIGILCMANSLCIKMYATEVLCSEIIVFALKRKKYVAPINYRLKMFLKKNPQAATRGLYSGISY